MGKSVTKTTNTNVSEVETQNDQSPVHTMSSEAFVYWLNGYFELSGSKTLTPEQVKVIKEHLALALTKVTVSGIGPTFHGIC